MTASAEVPVLGEALLRPVDRTLREVDRRSARFLARDLNPFLNAGAIANTCLIVAIATGVLLLFWYVPSVNQAYDSMVAMDAAPYTSGLLRSLHRYSSDACMLFVLLHALKVFFARQFTGPRWLAWVTGLILLFLLWVIGFLGYWLVWDQRAQQVAVGTAKVLDVLPIFADPMSRSFLVDETINSLLFFVVFFAHMLLPLAMGIALWLHIARLKKARFLTKKALTLWVLASLLLVSLVAPAQVADQAHMAVRPTGFGMDWWYLMPVALMDRLSGGALWLLFLLPGAFLMSMPWWMARKKIRPAQVDTSKCNSCGKCVVDCPYNAITLVPRTDGMDYPSQSQIDPSKCVGCGICAGSCDTAGIGLMDWFPVGEQRELLQRWLDEDPECAITLACANNSHAESAGEHVLELPCAGWIHPYTLERSLRNGAAQINIAACAPWDCRYRHGPELLRQRLSGERKPSLRTNHIDPDKIVVTSGNAPSRSRVARAIVAVAVVALFGLATWALSDAPYQLPFRPDPELVVSFNHPGTVRLGRLLTPEEKKKYPAYMKRERVILRERTPVRLRIQIDGKTVHEESHDPGGLWNDSNSIAIARVSIPPGRHEVQVAIGDTEDPAEWSHQDSAVIEFAPNRRCVVLFDRAHGFRWNDGARRR